MKHTLGLSNPTSPLGSRGLEWYLYLFSSSLCFNPSGFNFLGRSSPLPYPLPWTPDPLPRGTLELLIATCFPSCRPSFFHRFFVVVFERSWLDFASQLGSQNPQKSIKNRSKSEVKMGSQLGIDFSSILMDFGMQFESENGAKIYQKWH